MTPLSRSRIPAAVLALVAAVAVSCSKDSNSLGPPPPANFSATGDWTYTGQITDSKDHVTCDVSGIQHLIQTGSALSGSVFLNAVCSGPGGTGSDSSTVPIASGHISGTSFTIAAEGCSFSGEIYLVGSTPNAQGPATCDFEVAPGQVAHFTGTFTAVFVGDVTPPAVQGQLFYPADDTLAVPGDSVYVEIDGTDNVALRWLGYSAGAPLNTSDSVAVVGPSAGVTRLIVVLSNSSVPVTVFARDSAGLRVSAAITPITVLPGWARRPTVALPLSAAVQDIAIDSARGVIYLALAGQRQIGVVDLTSHAYQAGIALPVPGISVDLTMGGDSLLVASDSAEKLAIVSLAAGHATSVISLVQPTSYPDVAFWSYRVRAVNGNRAMVSVTPANEFTCCFGAIIGVDLTTGTSVQRVDAGYGGGSGTVSNRQTLARSRDGQSLMLAFSCCSPLLAQKYLPAGDAFTALAHVSASLWVYDVFPDRTASKMLLSNMLVDGSFTPVWTYSGGEYAQGGAAVLSPDGAWAYLATYNGYLRIRVSDGAVMEHIRTPVWAEKGAISADGKTLILVSGTPTFFQASDRLLMIDVQ